MKNSDPFLNEQNLCRKLDEYHGHVPDFPMKSKNKPWERFLRFLASPARDPLEPIISSVNGIVLLTGAPIMAIAVITLIQVILFLK